MNNTEDKFIITHKGYEAEVRYSEEDNCYYGKLSGIPDLVTFEAENKEDVWESFVDAVEDYLQFTDKILNQKCLCYTSNDGYCAWCNKKMTLKECIPLFLGYHQPKIGICGECYPTLIHLHWYARWFDETTKNSNGNTSM